MAPVQMCRGRFCFFVDKDWVMVRGGNRVCMFPYIMVFLRKKIIHNAFQGEGTLFI